MKKVLTVILMSIIAVISLCGCFFLNSGGNSCTMTVITSSGGVDISGKQLDNETFVDVFSVKAGDSFGEDDSGHWNQNKRKKDTILKIKKVGKDTVTFKADGVEMETSYGVSTHIRSLFSVSDGPEYSYNVVFGDVDESTFADIINSGNSAQYKDVICKEQNFSTICMEPYITHYEEGDGMYIQTGGTESSIPYIIIYRLGEISIDIGQFIEEVYIADAIEDYGDDLIGYEQFSDYEIAGQKCDAYRLNYIVRDESQEYSIDLLRVFINYGGEYVSFLAKYFESNEGPTLTALETAIENFSLDNSDGGDAGDGGASLHNSSSKGKKFNASDSGSNDVNIQPSEASLVRFTNYEDVNGYFTAQIPEGWKVHIGFPNNMPYDILSYPLTIYDPEHPERRVVYFNNSSGFTSDIYADRFPVIKDFSIEGIVGSTGNYWKDTDWGFTDFKALDVVSEYGNGKLVTGTCKYARTGDRLKGIFGHFGYFTESWTQTITCYGFTIITTAEEDAVDWMPVMLRISTSIKFTKKYDQDRLNAAGTVAQNSSYIAALSDDMRNMIASSWDARNHSYDIISQKNSDATLGYERVYDTETGDIYKATNGFTDIYSGERYQPITDDMYSDPIAGYIELN